MPKLRTAVRFCVGLVSLTVLSACKDGSDPVTGLSKGPDRAATVKADKSTAGSLVWMSKAPSSAPGSCLVAQRSTEESYLTRVSTISLPAGGPDRQTLRFAYRGWTSGSATPTLLAICNIADFPGAREYFSARFGGEALGSVALKEFGKKSGVLNAADWDSASGPQLLPMAGVSYVIDGLALESPAIKSNPTNVEKTKGIRAMVLTPCDPTVLIPDPSCDGWVEEGETFSETPPALTEPTSDALLPAPSDVMDPSTGGWIECVGWTDTPHLSTTPGFEGRINVKGHTLCQAPLTLTVVISLQRYQCFLWVFCGWPPFAAGVDFKPYSTSIIGMVNSNCWWRRGWYRGKTTHTVAWVGGANSATSYSYYAYIECW